MKQAQSITSLPASPDENRKRRMINYLIAMSIRVVCIIACLFVQGWWLLLPVTGAIVLPYVAVVLANVASRNTGVDVIRPGSLVAVNDRPAGGATE